MTQQDFINAVPQLRERMIATASRYLPEAADGEDVAQDVMIRLWEKKELFQSVAALQRYAAEAVKNTALNILRQRKMHPSSPVEYLLGKIDQDREQAIANLSQAGACGDAFSTVDEATRMEDEASGMEQLLMRAVKALPQRDRDLLRLRNVEDLPYPDIAHLLGISEVNVRVRLSRLRIALIKQIKSQSL